MQERATDGRLYTLLAVIAVVCAAFTLLYPSTPTYDPWSWIVWGREIIHFDLVTTDGPSWKPLTVIFTTLFAPFGSIAPDLWLVVGRAGAFMAVFLAFRLAWRLTGGSLPARAIAGVIAAMALFISSQFIRNMTLGNSEGLLVAFTLWGIERHLDGKYRQAFFLGFLSALLRPEIWPFLGLYGLWLMLIDRDRRTLILVLTCGVLIPVLWLLPEYWGSGNFWRAADRAQQPSPNSPAFAEHPAWQVIKNTWPLMLTPVKAAAAFALVVACWQWVKHRRDLAVISVFGLAVLWIGLIALMTEAGFSGNPRYIILGTTLIAVVGGVGFGRAVDIAGAVVSRIGNDGNRNWLALGTGVLACVVLLGATYHWAGPRFRSFGNLDRALRYQAELRIDLSDALDKVGGGERFASCGTMATGTYQVPMVAWYVHRHTQDVGLDVLPGRGSAVASRSTGAAPWAPPGPFPAGYERLVMQRTTHLYSTCPAPGA
ncbi:hypothetical protein [Conexibacter sp. CPCC 206217]|uniref:hypothetical protein n=1 Tax=Conexibacter sp. CPCC 206217 TaxID=3064574 RepID=UPI002728113A|nr:hypothetical protein [Conexibacter sp. CPCC 206217]MDO8211813.1 hypothetical protein [Conexibacter sp. CPCC 206217]